MVQAVTNLHVGVQPPDETGSDGASARVTPLKSIDESRDLIREALISDGKASDREYRRLQKIHTESGDDKSFVGMLTGMGLVSEQYMAETQARIFDIPLLAGSDLAEPAESLVPLSQRFLRERMVVPVKGEHGNPVLVMADPQDRAVVPVLQLAYANPLSIAVGAQSEIENAVEQLFGEGKSAMGQIVDDEDGDDSADLDVEQLKDMASEAPVIRLVNLLLQNASDAGASDIHIEPFEGQLKVRYRIDGVLHDVEAPPQKLAAAIISRIKIMAKLNIAERRLPQDGRIKLRIQGRDIDARVSTIPTMYGESVVMRLLNRGDVKLDLESLGFSKPVREAFLNILRQPNGLILVTGPTGSGKTTTLYAAIDLLNTDERKIITAEDPVEYQMNGVNQIQVKPAIGLTFAGVLRSIVRQDPDVILVGEMRDLETAKICVQSALTGHLVLSTLHTNSAAGSVTRLLEMGIEDYLLTSTVSGILSQRLVRKLCTECREPYTPGRRMIEEFALDSFGPARDITLYRPKGCVACNNTGYRGRVSILELLVIDDTVRALIHERADAWKLQEAANRNGMRSIFGDGCEKALAGVTSMDEILRVIQDG